MIGLLCKQLEIEICITLYIVMYYIILYEKKPVKPNLQHDLDM